MVILVLKDKQKINKVFLLKIKSITGFIKRGMPRIYFGYKNVKCYLGMARNV